MTTESTLTLTPMYRATTRPLLFADCERKPFLAIVLTCLALPFESGNYSLFLFTVPVGMLLIFLLRLVNKADPQWTQVYWRSLQLQDYYPAKAPITGRLRESWPKQFG